jgi:hypothetical protein
MKTGDRVQTLKEVSYTDAEGRGESTFTISKGEQGIILNILKEDFFPLEIKFDNVEYEKEDEFHNIFYLDHEEVKIITETADDQNRDNSDYLCL